MSGVPNHYLLSWILTCDVAQELVLTGDVAQEPVFISYAYVTSETSA